MKRHHLELLESRIAPATAYTEFFLGDINGFNGFTVSGGGEGGADIEVSAVANAGDVNGDGINDLLLGMKFSGRVTGGNMDRGRVALIFGQADGFPVNIDLDALGTAGVLIQGQQNFDILGAAVGAAGDVNGDGLGDFIISAPGNDHGVSGSEVGAAYVIFGRASWGATLALATLDGTNGFKIVGDDARTGTSGIGEIVGGFNLAGAAGSGDFNGDGFADVIVTSSQYKLFTQLEGGAVFVIFGKDPTVSGAFTTPLVVSTLNGTNGLAIGSSIQNDHFGLHAGFVGDVNQDGLTDLSVSNHDETQDNRRTFIVFGKASANPATIDVNVLTAAQGFELPQFTNESFVGPLEYGADVTMRDIDGDGDLDLGTSVTTFDFKTLSTYQGYTFVKNKGNGYDENPFGKAKDELRQVLFGLSNVAVDDERVDIGDFNGDGRYDLAAYQTVISDGVAPAVYFGEKPKERYQIDNTKDSSGVFLTGFGPTSGNGSFDPLPHFIGDLNGDGIDDVLLTPQPGMFTQNAFIVFGSAINPSKDGKSVTYRDVDGDEVTVKTSKGDFTKDMFTMSHPAGAVERGQQLDRLDLTSGGQDFKGANLTISVKKAKGGDGLANVLAIDATGIDLGTVKITGGLGAIDAGDGDFEKGGVKTLDVKSFGVPGAGVSDVVGRIGTIKVKTDVNQATLNVTGAAQGVGKIEVGGNFDGHFTLAGALETFKSADVLGTTRLVVQDGSAKKASITTKGIASGALLNIEGTIAKLTATNIGYADIIADRIDKLETKGDLAADITLDNDGAAASTKALGSAKVAGLFHEAVISVAGSVGSFTVGAMQKASLFVGFTPATPGAPFAGGTFLADASLGEFEATGKAFVPILDVALHESFIVATELGKTEIKSLDSTTGTVTWGFGYRDTIKSLKVKTPAFTYDTALGGTQTLDDFTVQKFV